MTANHEHILSTAQVRFAATFPNENFSLKGTDFDRWLAERDARIEAAAEQRGAVKGLKQLLQELMEGEFQVGHHAGLHTASTIISARLIELLVSADQMEGDDE